MTERASVDLRRGLAADEERLQMTSTQMMMSWQRRSLVNEAMNALDGWRDQCRAVWIAYSYWAGADEGDATLWYTAYSAALDREERAAERYAGLLEHLGSIVVADLEPMPGLAAAANRPW
jgi:hypothetical protein